MYLVVVLRQTIEPSTFDGCSAELEIQHELLVNWSRGQYGGRLTYCFLS